MLNFLASQMALMTRSTTFGRNRKQTESAEWSTVVGASWQESRSFTPFPSGSLGRASVVPYSFHFCNTACFGAYARWIIFKNFIPSLFWKLYWFPGASKCSLAPNFPGSHLIPSRIMAVIWSAVKTIADSLFSPECIRDGVKAEMF